MVVARRRSGRTLASRWTFVLAVAWTPRLTAQVASPPAGPRPVLARVPGITLDNVVSGVLTYGTAVQRARFALTEGGGRLTEASGPFDTHVSLNVANARVTQSTFASITAQEATPRTASTATYTLNMARLFRNGITLAPGVSVVRSAPTVILPFQSGAADVNLTLQIPLLRDRLGASSSGEERAARASFTADDALFRHSVSVAVRDAVNAYWDYCAAVRAVGVYRAAEERARQMLEDIKLVVKAEVRPAADLNQLKASLSIKKVTRVMAEQDVVSTWTALRLVLAMDADSIRQIAPPLTAFPEAHEFAPNAATMRAWTEDALRARDDYRASDSRVSSASILVSAAESDAKPSLDLVTSMGYSTLVRSTGVDAFVTPLRQNIPGMNATISLGYRLPVSNSAAAGRIAQQRARSDLERLTRTELARGVGSTVVATAIGLQAGSVALQESLEAVRFQLQALSDERRRFDLGASTLISVIIATDELTNAEITSIAARLRYAKAISALRFAEGRLLVDDRTRLAVDVPALLAP